MPLMIWASSHTSEWTPCLGFQWNFTRVVLPSALTKPERVDAEAFHGPVGAGDAAVGHVPHGVGLRLGVQGDEVPERVVGALGLRDLPVGVRLGGVDDVRELDAVLDEEHRDVVAHQVVGALVGVELGGEPAGIPDRVGGAPGAQDGGEPDEHGRLHVLGQEPCPGDVGGRPVGAEDAVRARAAGMDHALRDAFVVEVRDLLPQVVVLQQDGAARAGFEGMVCVARRSPWAVVRYWPDWAREVAGAPVGLPVGDTASGPCWSGLGGNGSRGAVGSSTLGGSGAGHRGY